MRCLLSGKTIPVAFVAKGNVMTQCYRRHLLATTLLVSAAAFTAPALAQDTAAQAPAENAPIIVTGSRIPQPNLESVAPITAISQADIKQTGTTKVEDLLNSLPSVFASQASGLANSADGTASVDLRGLGSSRTQVLVNGRRLLPGDPSNTSGSAADINMIPSSMLKRIEVLTGGASSVYGADAVAGVVNFIMDTEFEGFRLDSQYSFLQHNNRNKLVPPLLEDKIGDGLAGYDYPKGSVTDGGTFDATLSIGTSFADGRGHIVAYAGYRKTKEVLQRNRDYSACVVQNAGGVPTCGGSPTSAEGNVLLFDSAVAPGTSTFYTFAPNGGFLNTATLFNFAPLNHYQRPDERYTAGLFANYEINDAIKPYLEFMFMDDRTVAQIAPSGDFGNTLSINCDNPLMSATQRAVICDTDNLINGFLGTFPLAVTAPYNTGLPGSGTPGPTAAPILFANSVPGGAAYNKAFLLLLRRNVEGGGRRNDLHHTNFRTVIGSKGDLGKAWSYDAYYQYGRSNYSQVFSNEFSIVKLNKALDVVAGPGGVPTCRSVLDGTDPNCVPYNVFGGLGAASPASVAYLNSTGFQKGQTSEQVANVNFLGKLGEYGFKTPWANDGVDVNFGLEWRRESLELNTDEAFRTGDLTGQGGATLPIAGSFRVWEAFIETRIPIAQDSFVHHLSLDAGYRKSWYQTSANRKYDTDTYKIGIELAPIRDIRLRASYNRAVRAPNIQELFATPTVLLDGSEDACAGFTISATDFGCLAQGLNVGQSVTENPAGQYNGLTGGNQDLQPEKATTKTFGVVIQPSFAPRLSLTIDYYDIKIDNAIRVFGADAIIADCINGATATVTPASCDLVNRDPAGSIWLTPGGFITNLPNNVGKLQSKGIEVSGNYSVPVGGFGTLSFNLIGTYLDSYKIDNGLPNGVYDCAGLYGPTCSVGGTTDGGAPAPKWRHTFRASLKTPMGLGVSLRWRYVGKVDAETTSSNPVLHSDAQFEPGLHIGAQSYFDLTANYKLWDHVDFRLGVNNIFDKEPPLVTSGGGGGSNLCPTASCSGNTYPGTWDPLGRYIFAGVTFDF
jgi:iron complex outermembrane recepter protein